MKFRSSFVTNSSSSSFLIRKKDVDFDHLVHNALQDFFVAISEAFEVYDENEPYKYTRHIENEGAWPFGLFSVNVKDASEKDYESDPEGEYYLICNNDYVRFDFDLVKEIFTDKYKIPWIYGYID